MKLDEVADQLYGLDPSDFITARAARAAEARNAGDRGLATEVLRLRKPTAAAWLANLLARHHRTELERLLEVGDALRSAQLARDGDRLRQQSEHRREIVASLTDAARTLGLSAGHAPSGATLTDLEATLDAALADPQAGEALREGRLTTPLSYAGLGTGLGEGFGERAGEHPLLQNRPARPGPGRGPKERALAPVRVGEHPRNTATEGRVPPAERVPPPTLVPPEAHRAVRSSQKAAEAAERRVESVRRRLADARAGVDRLQAEARDAESQLRVALQELARAERSAGLRDATRRPRSGARGGRAP